MQNYRAGHSNHLSIDSNEPPPINIIDKEGNLKLFQNPNDKKEIKEK